MVIHLFGDKLKELRINKQLSQDDLGDILGVRKSSISNWETNKATPTYDKLKEIAQYFNVTTDYLLGLNQDDVENLKKLKTLCKELGIWSDELNDMTIDDFENAMKIVEMLKDAKI